MLIHTPGPQVGLHKAHSGIKWWSSENLEPRIKRSEKQEPRIPPSVNLPIVVWGCQNGYPDPCQSKPTRIEAGPHASELIQTRHRPAHTHQNPLTIVNVDPSRVRAYPLAADLALASVRFTRVAFTRQRWVL